MGLTRKERRQLRHLKKDAQTLLDEQRIVLGNAAAVAKTAGRQAKRLSDAHIAPSVNETLDNTVRPALAATTAAARRTAKKVRKATAPAVAAALANSISKLNEIESYAAADRVREFGERTGYLDSPRKKRGGLIALIIGGAVAAGVAYTLWQAFRTDEDLWVAPEAAPGE